MGVGAFCSHVGMRGVLQNLCAGRADLSELASEVLLYPRFLPILDLSRLQNVQYCVKLRAYFCSVFEISTKDVCCYGTQLHTFDTCMAHREVREDYWTKV